MSGNKISKNEIYGFDVLKFIMAAMIVAIHSANGFDSYPWQYMVYPFIEIAVPCFFVLSSYFFFKKIKKFDKGVMPFVKRIGTFYSFWFIVNIPLIIKMKEDYFEENIIIGIIKFFRDILFSYTFSGSWFLSALVLSVVAIYYMWKCKVGDWFILLISLIFFIYFQFNELLPEKWRFVYDWIAQWIRPEVKLTVVSAIPWVGMGYLLSNRFVDERLNMWKKAKTLSLVILLFLSVWMVGAVTFGEDTPVMIRPIFALSTLVLFFVVNIRNNDWCRILRECSILMYMVHFDIIAALKFSHYNLEKNQMVSFLFVMFLTLITVSVILFLRKFKYFRWLKYAS